MDHRRPILFIDLPPPPARKSPGIGKFTRHSLSDILSDIKHDIFLGRIIEPLHIDTMNPMILTLLT
jgi:hypothetical protein